jgi:predicted deacylase
MATNDPQSKHHFRSITYQGLQPGGRLIVTGAVHGNETCGTKGIHRVVDELESGALTIERGTVTFVPVTNPLAYAKGERAGDRNLNRNLAPTEDPKDFEDHVANWLCPLLARHEVLLDLHSTRARTQAFAMLGPKDNAGTLEPFKHSAQERALAKVIGVSRFVEGWLSTYEKGVKRRVAQGLGSELNRDPKYGVGTTEYMRSVGGYAMTLECGQHEDPSSPEVAYRAIRNTLAHLGLTSDPAPAPVQRYEALRIHDVIDRFHANDRFSREWSSFDRLFRGDLIGLRHDGTEVRAPSDGWILFPDAKSQPGHEWFYLAEAAQSI